MLSNKTYFLEEMTKQKNEKRSLKKELQVWQDKVAMLEEELRKSNSIDANAAL